MKRRTVHRVFGGLALACAAAVVLLALRLQQHERLNAAITEAAQGPVDRASAAPAPPNAAPEVRLARAGALSRAGAHDAAFKAYSALIRPGELDAIGREAVFNLGNMYLRQGLAAAGENGAGAGPSGPALPLVELAKQRYRDLLRARPGDWDARYNLERALRLAPEEQQAAVDETVPVERRRVMLRGMDPGDLP